jgi:hypothetical protein
MNLYQAIITFEMDEEFMSFVPEHRKLIEKWIDNGIVESYAVSLESMTSWITFNASSKEQVNTYLKKSPLKKYWTVNIDELFVYDSSSTRLPGLSLN